MSTGIELARDANGALTLELTLPVLNLFDQSPVPVTRDGDRIRVDAMYLDLTLTDGKLVGHYPGPNSPATSATRSRRCRTSPPLSRGLTPAYGGAPAPRRTYSYPSLNSWSTTLPPRSIVTAAL